MHISQFFYSMFNLSYRGRKWYLRTIYPRLAPQSAELRMQDGTELFLHPRFDYVQREIFLFRGRYEYEPHIVRWLETNLKKGMAVVEVGAHIGYYTGLICRKITPSGQAFFIEPLYEHYLSLRRALIENHFDWGQAINIALSDKSGETVFYPSTDSGRNSMVRNITTDIDPISVQTLPLDDFLVQYNLECIDLLIMDIEGAESLVVGGGIKIFKNHKVNLVLCELHPKQLLEDFNINPIEFINSITDQGYKVFRLDPQSNSEVPFEEDRCLEYQHLVFRY